MDDQRDQQTALLAQPAPDAPGTAERLARLILRRLARGMIVAGRLIRPRLGWLALTLFLVGIIGFETAALLTPLFVAKMTDNRPPAIPTSADVEAFLTGQSRYDADMMWESFSPHFQAALIDQGFSKDELASQIQSDRSGGKKYTHFSYVGGLTLQDDQRIYFYAVEMQDAGVAQKSTVGFTFTVDKSGKIISIQS